MDIKIDKVVNTYIKLRDKKAAMKKVFDGETAAINEQLETLENFIMQKAQELGVDSFKTDAGTAYRYETVSATVADWDKSLAFIQEQGAWNLLEHRVSKKAVEEYKETHGEIPPGINYTSMFSIGVRRS